MHSNFQSFIFIELIEKTRVRGALFVRDRSILGPKSSRFDRVDKAQGGGQNEKASQSSTRARVAELADALASGASDRKVVEVRVLSRAPSFQLLTNLCIPLCSDLPRNLPRNLNDLPC